MRAACKIRHLAHFLTSLFLLSGLCFAQSVTITPKVGPPTTSVRVSGSGFPVTTIVDIFFGATDLALVQTDAAGSFSHFKVHIPASALPGKNYISAVPRNSGAGAQAPFLVRTDWATYQFSSTLTGYNRFENVLSPSTVPGMGLLWSTVVGAFIEGEAVAEGSVYSTSNSGALTALNAATGVKRWTFTAASIDQAPTVANGLVYFGSEDNHVYALHASDGTVAWTFSSSSIFPGTPILSNGAIYVGSGVPDNQLYALNATTGALLWHAPLVEGTFSAVAVANGIVYAADGTGTLYAFNAASGASLWTYNPGSLSFASPAVANNIVYYEVGFPTGGGNGAVYALNATTGGLLWSFVTGSNLIGGSPAVANGVVYANSFDTLYALDAYTGALLWTFNTLDGVATPAVANGVVYVGSFDNNVYAVDAATGALLWMYPTQGGTGLNATGAAVANGVLYIGSGDNHLYAFGLPAPPIARPNLHDLHPDFSLKLSAPRAD